MAGVKSFMEEARSIVGDRWVYEEPWQLIAYSSDYWPLLVYRILQDPRAWRRTAPAAAVLPGSEEDVVRLVEAASRHGVRLVVYSGGTGVLGGAVPGGEAVVLDLSRLEWVRWYDEDAGLVDAGAGTPLAVLEEWLRSRGWSLRHYPQSLPEALIGGLVATRSTGQYSTGYGGIEDRVKGLHVVVPGIGLVRVRPSPRRSLLVSIEDLFTGSEGLLGVITRVYLEALRLPECERPVAWATASFREALDEARRLVQSGLAPELLRVYDEYEAPLALGAEGPTVIGVYEGNCRVVEARIEAAEKALGHTIRGWEEPVRRWMEERFNVIKSIRELLSAGLAFDTIEVSAPWGRILDVYKALRESAQRVPGVVFVGVHASHFYPSGAALYMTFAFDASRLEETYWPVWRGVMEAVSRAGGSIAHHHGVGRVRAPFIELEVGAEGARLMERLKKCLDPEGILREWPGLTRP